MKIPPRVFLFLFALTVLCFVASTWAQNAGAPRAIQAPASVRAPVTTSETVSPYHPTRILIQLTSPAASVLETKGGLAAGATNMGIPGLDALHAQAGAVAIRRSHTGFKNAAAAKQIGLDRWFTVEVAGPQADIEDLARLYRSDPNVEAATPDYRAFPSAVPNDPIYPDQWGHNNTGQMLDYCWFCGGHPAGNPVGTPGFDSMAEEAWDSGFGSSSAVIAILDTGADLTHPDLAANLIAGYDFGDNDPDPSDNSADPGHGTACSGVAAGVANNGVGVAGIAGNCSIMPLKVADSGGSLFFSYIQNALVYAADHGADVASMSFGAAISSDPATDAALQYAFNNGVVLLAATGNGNKTFIEYPAIHADVIGVGAASPCGDRKRSSSNPGELNPGVSADPNGYTCDGERWWGSNYGVNVQNGAGAVDVIAPTIMPTTDIQGSGGYDPGNYDMWFNGTSCATPYAAGVCGLIVSANPGWTPTQVRNQLTSTATDIVNVESGSGWDRYSGYGMVNAKDAVGGGCTLPAAPSAMNASPVGDMQIDLTWQDNSNNETDFLIERDSGSGFSQIAAVGAGVTNYSDTGLTCETSYSYRVRAYNACGYSGYSNTDTAVTGTCPGGSTVVGEVGQVVRNQTGAGADWYTVNLNNTYASPVVVMRGLSTNGGHKTHLRVRNSGATSFQWQQEEWDYHDGNHTTETCPYLVFEAGRHTLENGTVVEAGTASVTNGWATVTFSSAFGRAPVLLTGVMSQNDPAACITRTRNLGTSSFQIKVQEEEAADGVHGSETVAWVAFVAGSGTNNGTLFEARRTENVVTHNNSTINFTAGFSGTPIFLCHDDTYDGGNTCGTRYRTLNSGSATVFIEEEQSLDAEINHTTEVVSWLAWGSAGDIVTQGSSSLTQRLVQDAGLDSRPVTTLMQNYPNPLRGSTTIAFRLEADSDARLQVFDVSGRLVAVLAQERLPAGEYRYRWDGRIQGTGADAPAGIYLYRLEAGDVQKTKRMIKID